MSSFYSGAYAQPLQRQATFPVDSSDPNMGGTPAFAPSTSLGGPTSQPSRFRSILGSLSLWNQPTAGQSRNQGIIGGLSNLGKTTGLFSL